MAPDNDAGGDEAYADDPWDIFGGGHHDPYGIWSYTNEPFPQNLPPVPPVPPEFAPGWPVRAAQEVPFDEEAWVAAGQEEDPDDEDDEDDGGSNPRGSGIRRRRKRVRGGQAQTRRSVARVRRGWGKLGAAIRRNNSALAAQAVLDLCNR